jgi:GT2 family glycosyltransferase
MTDTSSLTVIVPVYRQWHMLGDLIAALAAQHSPGCPVEVLIVDNDPDHAGPRPALPPGMRYVTCPERGSYAARNAGAAQASGTLLAFTDADCRPDPGWAKAMVAASRQHRGKLLAGPVRMALPTKPNKWQIFDAVRGIPQALFVAHGYAATANLAVPADLLRALGGFDAQRLSGGDAEFCRRAGRAGHGLVLIEDAIVAHPVRGSFAQLATKARRIKGGQIAAGPLRRRMAWSLRSLTPPVREAVHYLRSPFPVAWRLRAIEVRLRLWVVELAELMRLLAGGASERR